LKEEKRLGPSVSLTLLRLNDWTTSIRTGGLGTLSLTSVRPKLSPAADLIKNLAESLIQGADGIERGLLSKALQETLLYCIDLDASLSYPQIKVRLTEFLERNGPPVLIQQFLSLCFFNFVWFQTSDAFRASAGTARAFEEDVQTVDRICQSAVASSWEDYASVPRPMDLAAAEELIRNTEGRLRGV
jgi:hypothetical protein